MLTITKSVKHIATSDLRELSRAWSWLSPACLLVATCMQQQVSAQSIANDPQQECIHAVIDKGLYLVADRALQAYAADQADTPALRYLRWHFANTFALDARCPKHKELAAEAKNLLAALQSQSQHLTTEQQTSLQPEARFNAISYRLLNTVNPDAPAPQVQMADIDTASLRLQLMAMQELYERLLPKLRQAINKHDATPPVQNAQAIEAHEQQAILHRYRLTHVLQQAVRPLVELSRRGQAWGLTEAERSGVVNNWLRGRLAPLAQELEDWDWQYGYRYIWLRHNCAYLLGIHSQLAASADRRLRDQVDTMYADLMQTQLADYAKSYHRAVQACMLRAWRDCLAWHMHSADPQHQRAGLAVYDQFLKRSQSESLWRSDSADRQLARLTGSITIYAARLHRALQEDDKATGLLSSLAHAPGRHAYAGHARAWLQTASSRPTAGWDDAPLPQDPQQSLLIAKALDRRAKASHDDGEADTFRTRAATILRGALLSLPRQGGALHNTELAAELFQRYAQVLAKRQWAARASSVSLEGLAQLTQDNIASQHLGGLANDAIRYSRYLVLATDSATAKAQLRQAIAYLHLHDPGKATLEQEITVITSLLQAERYAEARDAAKNLAHASIASDKAMALRASDLVVRALYGLSRNTDTASDLQAVDTELHKWLHIVDHQTDPQRINWDNLDQKHRQLFARCRRTIDSIRIGRLYETGAYSTVIKELGPPYWSQLGQDPLLQKQLLRYLIAANYKQQGAFLQDTAHKPEDILGHWQSLQHANRTLMQQSQQNPQLLRIGIAEQLAHQFSRLDRWLASYEAGTDGKRIPLTAADFAKWQAVLPALSQHAAKPDSYHKLFAHLASRSRHHAIELQLASLKQQPDKEVSAHTALRLANALFKQQRFEESQTYYQRYLRERTMSTQEQALWSKAEVTIAALKPQLAPNNALAAWWTDKKGGIVDLLHDDPDFIRDHLHNPQSRAADWPEEPRQLAKAYHRLLAYRQAVVAAQHRITSAKQALALVDELTTTVKAMALSIQARRQFIEASLNSSTDQDCFPAAKELWQLAPHDKEHQQLLVSAGLQAWRLGHAKTADLEQVQLLAAKLRNTAEQPLAYWRAAIQVLECAQALGQQQRIVKAMAIYQRSERHPAQELITHASKKLHELAPGSGVPSSARRADGTCTQSIAPEAMALIRRFHALTEHAGATQLGFNISRDEQAPQADIWILRTLR